MSFVVTMMITLISWSSLVESSPKERLKVKYKVKKMGEGDSVRMKVAEEVMIPDSVNAIEVESLEARAQPEFVGAVGSYKEVVSTMMSQLERAARSQDL